MAGNAENGRQEIGEATRKKNGGSVNGKGNGKEGRRESEERRRECDERRREKKGRRTVFFLVTDKNSIRR